MIKLGVFEELVLLVVGVLGEEVYGVVIKVLFIEKGGKKFSIGVLYFVLYCLEDKGLLKFWEGGVMVERGG